MEAIIRALPKDWDIYVEQRGDDTLLTLLKEDGTSLISNDLQTFVSHVDFAIRMQKHKTEV